MDKTSTLTLTGTTLFCLIGISSTFAQVLAANTQMTFYNTSNDFAMIELADSNANCIVQPHDSCPIQTQPQFYTVSVCVTYCARGNLFLYTEYSVYGGCDVYLNQTSPTNFTVTNDCPVVGKQSPKTHTLVLTTPDSLRNNTKVTLLPSCGIQCHVGVSDSIKNARDEIKKGNITGALLNLDSAQKALNDTMGGNNLAHQMLRNIH